VENDPTTREEYIKKLRSPERSEETSHILYLLLYADVGTGEGRVIFEPWFPVGEPQLLECDLAGDWVQALEAIQEEGLENFEDFASKLAKEPIPDHRQPIIVPFPTPYQPSDEGSADRPDPGQYKTEIPELRAMALSREQFDDVRACLSNIDKVLAKPQTVSMRVELAAALLAHACSAAYESAGAQGHPEEGQMRYDVFERLAMLRARELFKQKRA
jgi:hypothetical protein